MQSNARLLAIVALAAVAGCAARQNEYRGFATVPVSVGVACVADEIMEEGWSVVARSDAGLLRAEHGRDWIQATLVPGDGGLTPEAHQINLRTSDSQAARDAASELLEDCANS